MNMISKLKVLSKTPKREMGLHTPNRICEEALEKFKLDDDKKMKTLMHPTTSLRLRKESRKVDNTVKSIKVDD